MTDVKNAYETKVTSHVADGVSTAETLLEVKDLSVTLFTEDGALPAIQELSFIMRKGETLAVVGESGCGKSMTALSIMGLLPQPPAKIVGGSINFEGKDLAKLSRDEMRAYRGNRIGMIFQEPMTSLNPVMTAGRQIREGLLVHNKGMSKKDADARALEMIKLVGIPAPEKVFKSYPHELSGGMRQRVMIAMALACQPSLLICDEPTTALDVTIQAQILQLIDKMREELGTAVMLITHDMGVVSEMADWVLVMYAGRLVEYTNAYELFTNPEHPYTTGLIASIPQLDGRVEELYAIPGNVPMLDELPTGCLFNPRCPYARAGLCDKEFPPMTPADGKQNHHVACWKFTEKWGDA
jgi:peptide/nickel transport system ATP-binding protein/oligopeptide transport system ATP-binding protein